MLVLLLFAVVLAALSIIGILGLITHRDVCKQVQEMNRRESEAKEAEERLAKLENRRPNPKIGAMRWEVRY